MDKFAEKIADRIDSITLRVKNFKPVSFLKREIFGVRVKGEPIPEPRIRTIQSENRPSEFEWYQEFRVGSLHGVNQQVHLGQ